MMQKGDEAMASLSSVSNNVASVNFSGQTPWASETTSKRDFDSGLIRNEIALSNFNSI